MPEEHDTPPSEPRDPDSPECPRGPGNPEAERLAEMRLTKKPWRLWGPYLSDRQWGTVREDYSADGHAWEYFPRDTASRRAYRWGEDGIAGLSDDHLLLCFSLALWNGRDPVLKERLFGLTNREGNHGEDVKELYYYLDATPSHSYLKMLYKYPQREFPYRRLREENRRRGLDAPEFELLDTGVFDDDRYFDVFVEYAKEDPEDVLIRITAHNRGPEEGRLWLLPQLWFRNTWSWNEGAPKPRLSLGENALRADHDQLGTYWLHFEGQPEPLFCENESNGPSLWGVAGSGYYKDAFTDYLVHGRREAVNPAREGTKAALLYDVSIPAGGTSQLRLRLNREQPLGSAEAFDAVVQTRTDEANLFYGFIQRGIEDPDARLVQRQALAGMVWSKQFYYYDVPEWLSGDPAQPPPPPERREGRNSDWLHVNNATVMSMPDTWEFPWYAAWDLAFHTLPLTLIDPEFAKNQLVLLTREWFMHPDGQLPAYEWNLEDANPPVHAWAAWRVFQIDRRQRGDEGDLPFLERVFHKLLLNFTWWVNRKDPEGHNIFRGGFLGLDNIGVFDRSSHLPSEGCLSQADATSWMAMYCLNLLRISLELARHNHVYEDIATKFLEHFLSIAAAMNDIGGRGIGLWNEDDQFYYDVLRLPDGQAFPLKVRSLVGLAPLFAVEIIEPEILSELPEFGKRLDWYLRYRPDLANLVSHWNVPGRGERRLLSLLRGHRMKALLRRMLDPNEFLSDYGVRSISKYHEANPYVYHSDDGPLYVHYEPAESQSRLFGGNSNWRGPIWFPLNFLIIESLQRFHHYYGDDFRIEYPTGSGRYTTIYGVSIELTRRLEAIFLRDSQGRRAVFGDREKMQNDPHFRDYVLFHEYFHGDKGWGLGASHQTGWTGLIAKLLQPKKTP